MKYSIDSKLTMGAKRFLGATSQAFFTLLCKKPFEQITIGEICEESSYPRATFYNYFDDKYDLLGFFWQFISLHVKYEDRGTPLKHATLDLYFDRLYDRLLSMRTASKRYSSITSGTGTFSPAVKSAFPHT